MGAVKSGSAMMSKGVFQDLCCLRIRKTIADRDGKTEYLKESGVGLKVTWKNGISWGLIIRCCRILHESLQRTFAQKDQINLAFVCSELGFRSAVAYAIVTSDEPSKLQVIIIELADLISMADSGGVPWLRYSQKHGIILCFNSSKGYMDKIKSNPHVCYAAYTL